MKLLGLILLLPFIAAGQTAKLGDIEIPPQKLTAFDAPLSPALQSDAAKEGNPKIALAKAAVAVPTGFDPAKQWPIVVVSVADGGQNLRAMNSFVAPATAKGWIVLAADPPEKPKLETTEWRYALIAAAFDLMEKSWPGAKKWPVVFGGHSGGAKRSAYLAAIEMKNGGNVIGIFMSGCNEDRTEDAVKSYHPGPRYKDVPVFLSSGTKDNIATPAQHETVKGSLKHGGFKNVRLESHDGGHSTAQAHIAMALDWFSELHSKAPATGTTGGGSFDDFFKKK